MHHIVPIDPEAAKKLTTDITQFSKKNEKAITITIALVTWIGVCVYAREALTRSVEHSVPVTRVDAAIVTHFTPPTTASDIRRFVSAVHTTAPYAPIEIYTDGVSEAELSTIRHWHGVTVRPFDDVLAAHVGSVSGARAAARNGSTLWPVVLKDALERHEAALLLPPTGELFSGGFMEVQRALKEHGNFHIRIDGRRCGAQIQGYVRGSKAYSKVLLPAFEELRNNITRDGRSSNKKSDQMPLAVTTDAQVALKMTTEFSSGFRCSRHTPVYKFLSGVGRVKDAESSYPVLLSNEGLSKKYITGDGFIEDVTPKKLKGKGGESADYHTVVLVLLSGELATVTQTFAFQFWPHFVRSLGFSGQRIGVTLVLGFFDEQMSVRDVRDILVTATEGTTPIPQQPVEVFATGLPFPVDHTVMGLNQMFGLVGGLEARTKGRVSYRYACVMSHYSLILNTTWLPSATNVLKSGAIGSWQPGVARPLNDPLGITMCVHKATHVSVFGGMLFPPSLGVTPLSVTQPADGAIVAHSAGVGIRWLKEAWRGAGHLYQMEGSFGIADVGQAIVVHSFLTAAEVAAVAQQSAKQVEKQLSSWYADL